jgi:hypothetical protein
VIRIRPNAPDKRRAQPRSATCIIAATLIALGACSGPDPVVAPNASTAALERSEGGGSASAIEQFALTQGTWCDDATSLDCRGLRDYDIGWILGNEGANFEVPPSGVSLFYILDIGGVNARWWVRHHVSPRLPSYKIVGSVDESRLPDGRRRLKIRAEATNTFTFIELDHFDASGAYTFSDRLLGADFFQYPGVDAATADAIPIVADATADLDLVLPANFKGYPDLIQMVVAPIDGMEIRKMNVTVDTDGRLKHEYNGIPAGAAVHASVRDDWSLYLAGPLHFREPRITITRIRDRGFSGGDDRDNSDRSRGRREYERRGSRGR